MGSVMENRRHRNIVSNIRAVAQRVIYPPVPTGRKVSIVCYGPSLLDTWHQVDKIETIVSVSKAHDFLIDRGIIPHYHVEFDPRKHKAKHIMRATECTHYYLASCVHTDVVRKVAPWCYLWHAEQSGGDDVQTIMSIEPEAKLIPGGSSAGLRSLELFYALGFRHFDIYGMDSSFTDGGRVQWAGPHFGESRNARDVVETICGGKRFYTSLAFASYATQFLRCRRKLRDATFTLHGEGLLQTMAAEDQRLMEAA